MGNFSSRPGQRAAPQPELIDALLRVMEEDIMPKTAAGVQEGNKIFGAAMVRKDTLQTVFAATNNETRNPLNHGEVTCINGYYDMVNEDEARGAKKSKRPSINADISSKRVEPTQMYFLATHEPCTLCSSAITWAGFDNFYYFFSHEDSRDAFQIGHDLKILKEVFKHAPGGYARTNSYWSAYSIIDMIERRPPAQREPLRARAAAIKRAYEGFSETYQASKDLCRNIALK